MTTFDQDNCKKIADSISKGYPSYCFVIVSTQTYTTGGYTGDLLFDYEGARVYKLVKTQNNNIKIDNDSLKQQCFMWIYDSQSIKQPGKRRDYLKQKLSKKFTGLNFFLILNQNTGPWSIRNAKALCEFNKQLYGHQILVIVT